MDETEDDNALRALPVCNAKWSPVAAFTKDPSADAAKDNAANHEQRYS